MLLVSSGAAALAAAAVATVVAVRNWPLWTVLRRARPMTPERLLRAAGGGELTGRVVVVAGIAGAGSGGLLRSAVNTEPCVWHRHTVHRRRIRYGPAVGGAPAQRYSHRRRVADVASREPYVLRPSFPRPAEPARAAMGEDAIVRLSPTDGLPASMPATASVEVRPEGLRVHRPVARGLRVLPGLAWKPFPEALDPRVPQLYWHREWLLPAGVPLVVVAEVDAQGESVALRRPAKGPGLVTTRSASSLARRTAAAVIGGTIMAVLAGAAGAGALIVHYVQ
jgi:hypothetical protein